MSQSDKEFKFSLEERYTQTHLKARGRSVERPLVRLLLQSITLSAP